MHLKFFYASDRLVASYRISRLWLWFDYNYFVIKSNINREREVLDVRGIAILGAISLLCHYSSPNILVITRLYKYKYECIMWKRALEK